MAVWAALWGFIRAGGSLFVPERVKRRTRLGVRPDRFIILLAYRSELISKSALGFLDPRYRHKAAYDFESVLRRSVEKLKYVAAPENPGIRAASRGRRGPILRQRRFEFVSPGYSEGYAEVSRVVPDRNDILFPLRCQAAII